MAELGPGGGQWEAGGGTEVFWVPKMSTAGSSSGTGTAPAPRGGPTPNTCRVSASGAACSSKVTLKNSLVMMCLLLT